MTFAISSLVFVVLVDDFDEKADVGDDDEARN
jgi:hypothetical protein